MDGGEDVFPHHALGKHDGVLKVVSFPGHEYHLEVLAEGQFSLVRGIAVAKDLSLLQPLALAHNRLEVDAGSLVGAQELGQLVGLSVVLK